MAEHLVSVFRALLLSPAFPCLGGSGLVRSGDYCFAVYDRLGAPESIEQQTTDMRRYLSGRPADTHPFTAFVAAYLAPSTRDDEQFEALMWRQLTGMEAHPTRGCDRHIHLVDGDDPGYVFDGREFFVVGMHPASSRFSRRYPWPLLVFNALSHAQEMQKRGKHVSMSRKILERDRELQGSDNPSLHAPQRMQFSGRAVMERSGLVRPARCTKSDQ